MDITAILPPLYLLQEPVHPIFQDIVVDMDPRGQRDCHRSFDGAGLLLMILGEVQNQMGVLQLHVVFWQGKIEKSSP